MKFWWFQRNFHGFQSLRNSQGEILRAQQLASSRFTQRLLGNPSVPLRSQNWTPTATNKQNISIELTKLSGTSATFTNKWHCRASLIHWLPHLNLELTTLDWYHLQLRGSTQSTDIDIRRTTWLKGICGVSWSLDPQTMSFSQSKSGLASRNNATNPTVPWTNRLGIMLPHPKQD